MDIKKGDFVEINGFNGIDFPYGGVIDAEMVNSTGIYMFYKVYSLKKTIYGYLTNSRHLKKSNHYELYTIEELKEFGN